MQTPSWQRVSEICSLALDFDPSGRSGFVEQACGGDDDLRRQVELLLACHDNAGQFLETPAVEMSANSSFGGDAPGGEDELQSGFEIGPYRVAALLGGGGMGKVYRARDTRLNRDVALKVLLTHPVTDTQALHRFQREAQAASALNHPGICTVHDIGEHEGRPFLVMALLEGTSLKELLIQGPLPAGQVVKLALDLAEALEAAHRRGIVHRDLKPANILVTRLGQATILDFGLAKFLSEQPANAEARVAPEASLIPGEGTVSGPGPVLGTVAYMSPEQAQGHEVDARSDLFSLGATIYQMATGVLPFQGKGPGETLDAILHQDPVPPRKVNGSIPRELDRLILKALAKNREERFQNSGELRATLERLQRRPVRRRRQAMAGLIALGVATAATAWLWQRRDLSEAPPPLTALPFTTFRGQESNPSFSPDGTKVAFTWNGEKLDNVDVYVKTVADGKLRRLTTHPDVDYGPAWTPDGRHITFCRRSRTGSHSTVLSVPAEGGAEKTLAEVDPGPGVIINWSGSNRQVSWAPNGRFLLLRNILSSPLSRGLALVFPESGEIRPFFPPQAAASFSSFKPTFSPDGRTLAFVRDWAPFSSDLYTVSINPDGHPSGEPVRLTFGEMDIAGLDWLPDGRSIVFSSGREGVYSLKRAYLSQHPGPARLEPVPVRGSMAMYPSVSRQGNRLVYVESSRDLSIWRAPGPFSGQWSASGADVSAGSFIASTRPDMSPNYSPDGRKIAFVSDRSGSRQIWTCDSDGSNPRQLTNVAATWIQWPRWSPDSQWLVFPVHKNAVSSLTVTDHLGNQLRKVTSSDSEHSMPSWSRDGRWIYFGSKRSGASQIWKVRSQGGTPTQVTRDGGWQALETLDGKFLYYVKLPNSPGIWKVPVSGGAEVRVLDKGGPGSFAFLKEGFCLYNPYVNPRPTIEFYRYGETKPDRLAFLPAQPAGIPGFNHWGSVSPDGRWFLFARPVNWDDDLMMVENFR